MTLLSLWSSSNETAQEIHRGRTEKGTRKFSIETHVSSVSYQANFFCPTVQKKLSNKKATWSSSLYSCSNSNITAWAHRKSTIKFTRSHIHFSSHSSHDFQDTFLHLFFKPKQPLQALNSNHGLPLIVYFSRYDLYFFIISRIYYYYMA